MYVLSNVDNFETFSHIEVCRERKLFFEIKCENQREIDGFLTVSVLSER